MRSVLVISLLLICTPALAVPGKATPELSQQIYDARAKKREGVRELIGAGVCLQLGIALGVMGFVFQQAELLGQGIGNAAAAAISFGNSQPAMEPSSVPSGRP